jgi:hypothetical protein
MKAQDFNIDFESLIESVKERAGTAWERDFVQGIVEKFDTYGTSMFLSEKQMAVLCRIAGVPYPSVEEKQHSEKKHNGSSRSRKSSPPATSGIEPELLKRLISLCHPDKHSNSKLSTEVTQELLKMRNNS